MANDKPTVDFNLDTFTPEQKATPFAFVLGGKRYEMKPLDDLDAFDVLDAYTRSDVQATLDTLRLALGDDAYDDLRKTGVKKAGLDELQRRYLTHCGVSLGN